MENEDSVEQFMEKFFHGRTETLKKRLEVHRGYWRRFFHPDALFDSRRNSVQLSEAEKIVSILVLHPRLGVHVITEGQGQSRHRYQVQSSPTGWRIHEVDVECSHLAKGAANCPQCRGSGWLSWKDRATFFPPRNTEEMANANRNRGDQPEDDLSANPTIQSFMLRHFAERNESGKREEEIQEKFARQFFSPNVDWTRWLVSSRISMNERILGVEAPSGKVRVITSGFTDMQLRYHLAPSQDSWIITEVDMECFLCRRDGRKPNCWFCGGTIWEHRFGSSGDSPPDKGPSPDGPRWHR